MCRGSHKLSSFVCFSARLSCPPMHLAHFVLRLLSACPTKHRYIFFVHTAPRTCLPAFRALPLVSSYPHHPWHMCYLRTRHDSGKSTLIGVLSSSGLDDGRGAARSLVLRHRHEQENGRTSAVTMEIMGYAKDGQQVRCGALACSSLVHVIVHLSYLTSSMLCKYNGLRDTFLCTSRCLTSSYVMTEYLLSES